MEESGKNVALIVNEQNCQCRPWNNGKSGAKLDLTSSTNPGLQMHKFDHTRTANPCDWLPCHCAALPLVGCLSATYPSC